MAFFLWLQNRNKDNWINDNNSIHKYQMVNEQHKLMGLKPSHSIPTRHVRSAVLESCYTYKNTSACWGWNTTIDLAQIINTQNVALLLNSGLLHVNYCEAVAGRLTIIPIHTLRHVHSLSVWQEGKCSNISYLLNLKNTHGSATYLTL